MIAFGNNKLFIKERYNMFKIYNDTIFYVLCPANKKTGGTELAHQLVNELNKNGVNSVITYYYWDKFEKPINDAFEEYVKEYKKIDDIEDNSHNILVVPEINWDKLNKYNNIQKGIWWMSVDNYVKNDGFFGAWKVNGFVKALKALVKGNVKLCKSGFDKSIMHFYQSEYARQFLIDNGVLEPVKLSDYVNDAYLNVKVDVEKENNVLYNPKKGIKFTKMIIDYAKDLNWIPLQNMTTEEVKEMLSKSKVYIDFGNHPGKDRFPREAAISGCCVITGKKGSAAFYEDIPIDDKFKFDSKKENVPEIVKKIRECLDNYEDTSKCFEKYREMIANEHKMFEEDTKKLVLNCKE